MIFQMSQVPHLPLQVRRESCGNHNVPESNQQQTTPTSPTPSPSAPVAARLIFCASSPGSPCPLTCFFLSLSLFPDYTGFGVTSSMPMSWYPRLRVSRVVTPLRTRLRQRTSPMSPFSSQERSLKRLWPTLWPCYHGQDTALDAGANVLDRKIKDLCSNPCRGCDSRPFPF